MDILMETLIYLIQELFCGAEMASGHWRWKRESERGSSCWAMKAQDTTRWHWAEC